MDIWDKKVAKEIFFSILIKKLGNFQEINQVDFKGPIWISETKW